ncbi:2-succinyl-5-enolpyruvyl-6-hydroxy-3-cyclohexene-1-carboxylic-acid synthase [Longibacter salinarum]|uniref:2-succinyl-5-enolpyruvyl-6-hydroxy-3-cyclohexene-1-carboxylate synthase n=1 Tax=Longibacter salinarum TaxID=1850348 RepID=A0A2A8D3U6_9BACT|nr:2-succinyl-5-enolpyruvyl-6-hydroxy-3-cyclohexene-1-carboxylic-acid synthase [Longibacter salinarum]PEN15308.1 2-succinyl-5-enolpyruvyl-6-hydroxy-3-cyclohexene-1-carboxylic-acid synthase [Longibacter salinarum]
MTRSPLDAENTTYLWARSIVEELVRCGIDTFFVAPGSRSTPLTVSVAEHPDTQVVVHVDERGTAFAALGYGRATGRPAGWITTSGTAVANGLPAVVEASVDGVPLLCLTADRPPELRGSGANQTIDQVDIFGSYPRHFVDLPPPSGNIPLEAVLSTVDEAVSHAMRVPPGPVHLNAGFRKPLEPVSNGPLPTLSKRLRRWAGSREPLMRRPTAQPSVTAAVMDVLAQHVRGVERGLIVAGRLDGKEEMEAVRSFAEHVQWPLIPDITSGLRLGSAGTAPRVAHADSILADSDAGDAWAPEVVLHFGGRAVSKRLRLLLRDAAPSVYAVVRPDPSRFDPDHRVTDHIEARVAPVCAGLVERSERQGASKWTQRWLQADTTVAETLQNGLMAADDTPRLSEPGVARLITRRIPASHALVLASSMPVRDANRYAHTDGARVSVLANRGASGIDGTIATAAGCTVGTEDPATLVIGDLAALHDMSSLALLQKHPVVVVLINNEGGGIFHFLPISDHDTVFESYFATPQSVDFSRAVEAFGLHWAQAQTLNDLASVYDEACGRAATEGTSTIIEVQTDRNDNRHIHDRLDTQCAEAVAKVLAKQ